MAVMRTWNCAAHGEFTAFVGKCPNGCGAGMVRQVMGASILSSKTKFIDKTMNTMAKEMGLTDMNNRGGQAVTAEAARWEATTSIEKKRLTGQTYSMPVATDGKGKPVGVASIAGQVGASTDQNIVATMAHEGRVSFRPNIVADDHQRIKPEDIK